MHYRIIEPNNKKANGNFLVIGKKDDKDEEYKKEILDKINELTVQLSDLQHSLQNS